MQTYTHTRAFPALIYDLLVPCSACRCNGSGGASLLLICSICSTMDPMRAVRVRAVEVGSEMISSSDNPNRVLSATLQHTASVVTRASNKQPASGPHNHVDISCRRPSQHQRSSATLTS